jgi:hypothetical protein
MTRKSAANRTVESGSAGNRQTTPGPQPSALMARVRLALAAGNVRGARSLSREIVAAGPDAERVEAAAILERTRPDPRALITTLSVIAIILFAAWAAILHAH